MSEPHKDGRCSLAEVGFCYSDTYFSEQPISSAIYLKIVAMLSSNGFLVALTYGPGVDWYGNIKAVESCMILRCGCKYDIEKFKGQTGEESLNGIMTDGLDQLRNFAGNSSPNLLDKSGMNNLGLLRESKEALEQEEILLLRATSLQESVYQWLRLQSAFEWQLQQTATLFEQDRRNAMIELQNRLRRLID